MQGHYCLPPYINRVTGMAYYTYPDKMIVDLKRGQRRLTQHFDFVDGCAWMEVNEHLPLTLNEYSSCPISVFASDPCKVITADGNINYAVYVRAYSMHRNNDGTLPEWVGWAEIPDWPSWSKAAAGDRDWRFVEDVLHGDTIDVLRWHYYNDKDK